MAKECTLCTGNLNLGGLPRNSVVRIADSPDIISAVYRGRKATNQTHKQTCGFKLAFFMCFSGDEFLSGR